MNVKFNSRSAVVIGAGIVGLCSALQLQRQGVATILIDPMAAQGNASWGNAGHIAIEQVEPLASLAMIRSAPGRLFSLGGALSLPPRNAAQWLPFLVSLARASRPRRFAAGKTALSTLMAQAMPAWRRLGATLPQRDLLIERGHIVAWHNQVAAKRGIAAWLKADIGSARLRIADAGELALFGRITAHAPAGAVIFDNTGQVADPGSVCGALTEAFVQAGGIVRPGQVRSIVDAGGKAGLVLADGEQLQPDHVLLAAGVASGQLMAALGLRVPIIAERGYHIQAANHRWPSDMPPVVFEERSMIVSRFDGGLRAASFVEFGRAGDPPDPRKWKRLEKHVAALGLPVEGPFTRWNGARPTLPDYLPALGRLRRLPNVFYAFGHQHLGLTLGPITGELVAGAMLGQEGSFDLAPYDVERFN